MRVFVNTPLDVNVKPVLEGRKKVEEKYFRTSAATTTQLLSGNYSTGKRLEKSGVVSSWGGEEDELNGIESSRHYQERTS